MTQLVQTELRLVAVIREGRDLLDKLVSTRHRMTMLLSALPKGMVDERAAIQVEMDQARATINMLKAECHAATTVAQHIESHHAWKNAIRSIWGEEGIEQCIRAMQTARVDEPEVAS